MIKNERQYLITKKRLKDFHRGLKELQERKDSDLHPLLKQAEFEALNSQIHELESDLREYEEIRSAKEISFKIKSFDELPSAIIKARIASGLSQKDLADRLGMKEQQIQRYESTSYKSISLERLFKILRILGINLDWDISLSKIDTSFNTLKKRLESFGLSTEFAMDRIIPSSLSARIKALLSQDQWSDKCAIQIASYINRIYAFSTTELFSSSQLKLSDAITGQVQFKLPLKRDVKRLNAYVVYAHYLALLVLENTQAIKKIPIPSDPMILNNTIRKEYGDLTFKHVLLYIWSLGIPVLPLRDPGFFHGACWRFRGRNIIVIKQNTHSLSRWLFDLLHELKHAAQYPDHDNFAVIEAPDLAEERTKSGDEEDASCFAGDVILSNRSEELAKKCVSEADGRVEGLKKAVTKIAKNENVPVDSLANYLAFRLSLQGINWWGAASNLQNYESDPWEIARDIFLEKFEFDNLNDIDRDILMQALTK